MRTKVIFLALVKHTGADHIITPHSRGVNAAQTDAAHAYNPGKNQPFVSRSTQLVWARGMLATKGLSGLGAQKGLGTNEDHA